MAEQEQSKNENQAPVPAKPALSERKFIYHIEEEPTGDRVSKFLKAFAAALEYTNYKGALEVYSRSTAKCARCSAGCPIYEVTGNDTDIPCYRTNILLNVYRRYFQPLGGIRMRGWHLTERHIDELKESLWRCTACRRCMMECPMGIDHGFMAHFGRYLLSEVGIMPRALRISTREQLEGATHNTSAIPVPALTDTLEFLEEELLEITGQEIKFPMDVEGAEYLFVPAVSDFMMEADTLMGNAAVMHACGYGRRYTIGTKDYDGINYGLFYSDWAWDKIIYQLVQEAERLKCPNIMIGECGHASRAAKYGVPVWGRELRRPVINCMEFTLRMYQEGKLPLVPGAIKDRTTYHDPCNISRVGWIVEQPRELLKAISSDFVEMTPNRRLNYCCGGGGGSVSCDETYEFRMEVGGRRKAEQLKETGAKYVVAPCANCKKQLRELIDYHKLDMELVGLHDLLLHSIDWDKVKY
ncbi:MAG: (Fe-S)-binding protein [bacterium]